MTNKKYKCSNCGKKISFNDKEYFILKEVREILIKKFKNDDIWIFEIIESGKCCSTPKFF